MATHKSAVKRHGQSLKRQAKNRQDRATIRTAVKKTNTLAEQGSLAEIDASARAATKLIAKAGTKGLLKKGNAKRTISRLQSRVAKAKKAAAK